MKRILTLTFAVVLTCAWGGAAAHAQPTSLQQEVNQVLAKPGFTDGRAGNEPLR